MDKGPGEFLLSSLIGVQVKTEGGECLGKIEDLVVDQNSGHVTNLVLSLGDAQRSGSALYAIPWEALKSLKNSAAQHSNSEKSHVDGESSWHVT